MSDAQDVDHLLRTARADVARLALQMRAARQAVEPAAPGVPAPEEPAMTAADLGVRPGSDPLGLAEDLARVRADALRLISSARAEVAQRVAASSDDVLGLLRGPTAEPGASSLRVVVPPAAPTAAPLPVAVAAPAADVPPVAPPEDPAMTATEVVPVVPAEAGAPDAAAPVAAPVASAPMVPAAIAAARAAVTAVPEVAPTAPDPLGGVVVVVTVPSAGAPAGPIHGYAPAPEAPAEPKRPAPKVLYADVVLPILAVVVLLIILLAWVG